MTSKGQRKPTYTKRMKDLDDARTDIYSLVRRVQFPLTISVPSLNTGGGSLGGSGGAVGGNFLPTAGGTMIGPIAFFPQPVTISTGQINIGSSSGDYTSYVIVLGQGGIDDDLDTILNGAFSGQELFLQATSTTQITLKHATGNIHTPAGADFVIPPNNIAQLILDPTSGSGVWRVIGLSSTGGAGDFANRALSNLSSPTTINQTLLPDTDALRDLGSALKSWDSLFVGKVRFDDAQSAPTASSATLTQKHSTGGMDFNVDDSADKYFWYFDGVNKYDMSQTSFTAPNIILSNTLTINDSAIDPSANGQFSRNSVDVKVYSGGAVRSLSDIGAAGGANVNLSNLAVTSINQDLLPQAGKKLGDSGNIWSSSTINKYVVGTAGTIVGADMSITGTVGGALSLNFPTGGQINVRENDVSKWTLSSTSLTGANIILSNTFTLNDSVTNPSANGQFTRNGTSVKVQSADIVITLDNLATRALNNLSSVAINTSLLPASGDTIDLGSGTFDWNNLFVNDVRLQAGGAGVGGARQLYGEAAGITFNTPTATKFFWDVNNVSVFDMSSTVLTGPNIILSNTLTINDSVTDPSSNGQFSRNSTDVKVFSGGAVRNLSSVGSGGVSLPIDAPIDPRGLISGPQIIDLSLTTAHYHTMTLNGDISFSFINPPAVGNSRQFTLDITQNGVGGHSISFVDPLETSAIDVNQAANARTVIICMTRDGGATYSTFGSALTPTVTTVGVQWSDPVTSSLIPNLNNIYDLGTVGAQFRDIWIDNDAHIDNLIVDFTVASHLLPQPSGTFDLGGLSGPNRWRDLWMTGLVSANQIALGITNAEAISTGSNWQRFGNMAPASVTTPSTAATINLFLDSSTGQISVKKSTGLVVSLESSGGGATWSSLGVLDTNIIPDSTANARSLGSTTNRFGPIWSNGIATLGALVIQGTQTWGGAVDAAGFAIQNTGTVFPQVTGVPQLGDSTHYWDIGFMETLDLRSSGGTQLSTAYRLGVTSNNLFINVPSTRQHLFQVASVNEMTISSTVVDILGNQLTLGTSGQNITTSGAGVIYESGVASNIHFFENGGVIDFQVRASNARMIGGGDFRSSSATEIGYKVTNATFAVGTEGTLQIPQVSSINPTDLSLDGFFGSGNGCMGVTNTTLPNPKFHIKVNGNWNHVFLSDTN